MSTANTSVNVDFFTSAKRMSLTQMIKFFNEVILKMDPKDVMPIILWAAPGVGKSESLEQIFSNHVKGFKTVITSQLSAVDALGLAHIDEASVDGHRDLVTRFTPTEAFGRGKQNLFLDELNNASPSMQAAVMNLLSSRKLGEDTYNDVFLVAACNPPSTSSLASDLAAPMMNRCLHIVIDYTLDDFISYAAATGEIHPSVVAFHKKTSGQYLQANWEVNKNRGYQIPEPVANSPFPSPRAWTKASKFLNTMSKTGKLDYEYLQPMVEGIVGPQAASAYATTYAYMNRLPDMEAVFEGKLKADEVNIKGEVVIEYLSTFAAINLISAKVNDAKTNGIKCQLNSTTKTPTKGSPTYNLLAGMHRLLQFINDSCSPELSHMVLSSSSSKLSATLPGTFSNAFFGDIDVEAGLTRAKTFEQVAKTVSKNNTDTSKAFGQKY